LRCGVRKSEEHCREKNRGERECFSDNHFNLPLSNHVKPNAALSNCFVNASIRIERGTIGRSARRDFSPGAPRCRQVCSLKKRGLIRLK
jgi:hypothetical protein